MERKPGCVFRGNSGRLRNHSDGRYCLLWDLSKGYMPVLSDEWGRKRPGAGNTGLLRKCASGNYIWIPNIYGCICAGAYRIPVSGLEYKGRWERANLSCRKQPAVRKQHGAVCNLAEKFRWRPRGTAKSNSRRSYGTCPVYSRTLQAGAGRG